MEAVLQFDQVTYYYESRNQRVEILENVSFDFFPGKLYAIVGPSGSGKTTSLTLAGGLEDPKSGSILYKGKNLKEIGYTAYRNQKIGFVFQSYNLLNYLTPYQNVLSAMEITSNVIPSKRETSENLLLDMGITKEQMGRNINELSGGEQQRVAIARALATNAEILLADEPTGNLDVDTSSGIMDIFQQLACDGRCVIVVTHSQEFAARADVVIQLKNHSFHGPF